MIKYKYKELPSFDEENIEEYIQKAKEYFPFNTIKHVRVDLKKERSEDEQKAFEKEEIRRCREGYKNLCGSMYFYFNYCKITSNSGGRRNPDFRVADACFFELMEACDPKGRLAGQGIVCVKARRGGFSWKAAAYAIWKGVFFNDQIIGMDSKTDVDSMALFSKCKQIYDELPFFLRYPILSARKDGMEFGFKEKDDNGSVIIKGRRSNIFTVAPTDSAYEGQRMNVWFSDEAGKKPNLMTMWNMTIECMVESMKRTGVPIIFGTAGDVDKGSYGLKELWEKSDSYMLEKFFFPGWSGIDVDDYGNDKPEKVIREILKTRNKKRISESKDYKDYLQKYPMNSKEALTDYRTTGIGHIQNIKKQKDHLIFSNPPLRIGYFRWGLEKEDKVVFVPSQSLREPVLWNLYENKQNNYQYIAGSDPADHDNAQAGASNLACYIMAKQNGSTPAHIVAWCCCRPAKLNDWYDQCIMAQIYYNGCKNLIENNRYGMIKHYENNGYTNLIKEEPAPKNNLIKKFIPRLGARKTPDTENEMARLIYDYTDDRCDLIPDIELLEELLRWGVENVDRAVAFAWTLVHLEDVSHINTSNTGQKRVVPQFKYKNIGGKIIRSIN